MPIGNPTQDDSQAMLSLASEHWPALQVGLDPERCCSLHAPHVIATGHGSIWVDRWPAPRAVAAFTGGNLGLTGDPRAVSPGSIAEVVAGLLVEWDRVFIDPGPDFEPTVRRGIDALRLWPRVLYSLAGEPSTPRSFANGVVRAIDPGDEAALSSLDASIKWISDTHDGAAGLAASGRAVGAFSDGRLTAVATVFYTGTRFEELGVVTDPEFRGSGLSTACAAFLIEQIRLRGRTPCWSTTPDNLASQRVAEKLGFGFVGAQRHLMAGEPMGGTLPLD